MSTLSAISNNGDEISIEAIYKPNANNTCEYIAHVVIGNKVVNTNRYIDCVQFDHPLSGVTYTIQD